MIFVKGRSPVKHGGDSLFRAIRMAEEFSPDAVQIMIDMATGEQDADVRMKAIALLIRFLEINKDVLGKTRDIDMPIEKLTTREIVNLLIPDMREMNEVKQIGE